MTSPTVQKHANIFLAEDNSHDVYFIEAALNQIEPHLKIERFKNGEEILTALSKAEPVLPGMVMLDLNMPVLDGRETLRLIRAKYGESLPVIIFSDSNHQHEKELCFEYGANAFHTKPPSLPLYKQILASVIDEWFERVDVHKQDIKR